MRPVFHAFCKLVNRFALRVFVIGGPRARQQFSAAGVRGDKIVPFAYATLTPQETNLSDASVRPGAVFVFAGSFCRRKAVDVIAEAWRRLVEEHPESRLVLVGGGDLVDLFKGLAGVEYVGAVRQEEIYGAISRGDVMLLPSRWDPWGASLVEGGMAGLAMVGSDRTGAADSLVEDGKNGFVVRSGDADDLLRVMRLYAADPKLARRHGQEAKVAAERTSGDNLARLMLGFKMGEDL